MNYFEIYIILLKPVLGGVSSVEHFITGNGSTQLRRVCTFLLFGVLFGVSLATVGSNCCMTVGDPWTAKQHHLKSEAKEDHQLRPGEPSNRRKSSGPNQLK